MTSPTDIPGTINARESNLFILCTRLLLNCTYLILDFFKDYKKDIDDTSCHKNQINFIVSKSTQNFLCPLNTSFKKK